MASNCKKSANDIDTIDNDAVLYMYTTLAQLVNGYDEYGNERFKKFSEREFRSDFSHEVVKGLCHGKYRTRWCEVSMMKGATDLTTYQEMLQEIHPRTIIELGTWLGASAAWFGDLAKIFGLECHVYSMDITNPDAVDKRCHRDNVSFLHGDCNKIEETFTPAMLKGLPHPWIVIDDAHVNVIPVLEYFTAHMLPGDYLIKEDVSSSQPRKPGMGLIKEMGWEPTQSSNPELLVKFMERNADNYRVDRYYCDMYGYNGNNNWNAYLKRV
ncbi:uncharacterized protein LOC135490935 isoform X2 [Lineus longissimus]